MRTTSRSCASRTKARATFPKSRAALGNADLAGLRTGRRVAVNRPLRAGRETDAPKTRELQRGAPNVEPENGA